MIQSHYVPSERPYRIIYTGGVVGLQIGTLIVVDDMKYEQPPRGGNIATKFVGYMGIETHSYPVVSYINKDTEKHMPYTSDIFYDERYYSESVVWNNVKAEDVATICLEGQKVVWEEMRPLIERAVEKCTDMETTRREFIQLRHIFTQIKALGGGVSRLKHDDTENGKYLYDVTLLRLSYEDEEENTVFFFTTAEGDEIPFFATDNDEAFKVLDYQCMMYERIFRSIDLGAQCRLRFQAQKSDNDEDDDKLLKMVRRLNSRHK